MIYTLHYLGAAGWRAHTLNATDEAEASSEAVDLHVAVEAKDSRILEISDDGTTRVLAVPASMIAETERERAIDVQRAVATRAARDAGALDEARASAIAAQQIEVAKRAELEAELAGLRAAKDATASVAAEIIAERAPK